MRSAREAVAADYARRRVPTTWDRIVLTASTSEAYSVLFKLLCAPEGDQVLVPAPSYPLFDHLTALDGVGAVQYALHYDGRWWVDLDTLDAAWNPAHARGAGGQPEQPDRVRRERRGISGAHGALRRAGCRADRGRGVRDYPSRRRSTRLRRTVRCSPACLRSGSAGCRSRQRCRS